MCPGASRVREASTDGYTYDDEFPALLRGACSVRCARDCGAGAWGEWGPCAAEPGSRAAFRFRTRYGPRQTQRRRLTHRYDADTDID